MSDEIKNFFSTYTDFVTKVTSDPSIDLDALKNSFDDIERPAASSPAALILLPVDKRSIATFISEFDLLRLARTIEDI